MKLETSAEIHAPLRQELAKDTEVPAKASTTEGPSLLDIFSLVLWLSCLLVGAAGFALPYPRPQPPAKEPTPVQAETLRVELTKDASPPDAAPPPDAEQPPPPPDAAVPPAAPPLTAVTQPDRALAFALPVEGPTRQVDARQAAHTRPTQPTQSGAAANAAPQQLTYGQGEGKQPAPEYPQESMLAGQQGAVRVLFSVAEDGHVTTAKAVGPCPFLPLNQSALRAVRDHWHFRSGPARVYEVTINFQLKQ